jgi:arsenical pump membrane protein
VQEAWSVGLLVAVLVVAVARPRGAAEAVGAVPAALLLLLTASISWPAAGDELRRLGPVVGFLAAVLALASGCAGEGLFDWVGAAVARAAVGRPVRLLALTFAAASVTTAVLSLDTTVVLLTPVLLVSSRRAGVSPRPSLYAAAHLSNTASLLLPVSNLTNLLALAVVPLSFTRFMAVMALPWLAAVVVELVVFRVFFRRELRMLLTPASATAVPTPKVAVVVVTATFAGFVATSLVGVAPVWAATAGAVVLAGYRLARRRTTAAQVVRSAAPLFCVFVLALGVVVRAASDHGLGAAARHLMPSGSSLPALIGVAVVGAVAANVLNNLPATLLLLPVAAQGGIAPVLALLVGVDIGPNLTYVGSLATLLWRRVLAGASVDVPRLGEFTLLAAATVPVTLAVAVVTLWLSLRWIGV